MIPNAKMIPHNTIVGELYGSYLDQENHRHPLVVGDHVPLVCLVLMWDILIKVKVISGFHPAIVVGVLFVTSGEMCRNPASDRTAYKLTSTGDDGEKHLENIIYRVLYSRCANNSLVVT